MSCNFNTVKELLILYMETRGSWKSSFRDRKRMPLIIGAEARASGYLEALARFKQENVSVYHEDCLRASCLHPLLPNQVTARGVFFLPWPTPRCRDHLGAVGQLIPHTPKTSISASQTQSNLPSNLAKSPSRQRAVSALPSSDWRR